MIRKRLLWAIMALNIALVVVMLLIPLTCLCCDGSGGTRVQVSKRLTYRKACDNCGGRKKLTVAEWGLFRMGVLKPLEIPQ